MTAAFTILLPHRRNPGNNRAVSVALSCLQDNTTADFRLLMDAATDQPLYERINRMVRQADTEYCVYWSSDLFCAKDWDTPMLALVNPTTFVNPVLVEPGAIGVYHESLLRNFGMTPETFDRAAFEQYAANEAPVPNGKGWFAGYMFPRDGWLLYGGLEAGLPGDDDGFTNADIELFDRWLADGNSVVRAKSFMYHCQRYSEEHEQSDPKRFA